jgi:anti-sigma factor RsiW
MDCKRYKTDGMRLLDGEMTAEEQLQYEEHVQNCAECERELREMGRIVKFTDEVHLKKPDEQFWADYWRGVYRRLERGIGFFLLAAGLLVLTAYGIFKAVTSPEFFTVKGIATAVVVLGLWIVFLSVVRERYHEYKHDPYKGVQQ